MKKKCLESLQMNIKLVTAKNVVSITCIFNQLNLFNSLIHSSFSSALSLKKNPGEK